MKSFKEYLLEGQAEVDAAIKAVDAANDRERKIWHARGRLEAMVARATNQNVADSQYYKLNRKASQKVNRIVNPTLKKTFRNLSPEDRLQFLLSPHNSLSPESVEFHDKYSPGGAAGQTMYDKISRSGQGEMFPLKDLRDAEDLLSVVRSEKTGRSFHPKDRNSTRIPISRDVAISDAGDAIVMGGTFHERKKMRKELNKRKSSKD
jgi:hypothetical protein